MKTQFYLPVAGLLLANVGSGLGQPIITNQPQSCTNVVGTTATFLVGATGTEPLAYQWQKNAGTWTDLVNCTTSELCTCTSAPAPLHHFLCTKKLKLMKDDLRS